MRLSFEPGTRWSTSTPSRRPSPGRNSATADGRLSRPSIGSTTMPSTRRSCPQTRSTSAASWMPSTQIRVALAVLARRPATALDPDADRCGAAGALGGRTRVAGAPSTRNAPGASGKTRRRPLRSSRVTAVEVHATTAPQKPDSGSSATVSMVAGITRAGRWARRGVASTSRGYEANSGRRAAGRSNGAGSGTIRDATRGVRPDGRTRLGRVDPDRTIRSIGARMLPEFPARVCCPDCAQPRQLSERDVR